MYFFFLVRSCCISSCTRLVWISCFSISSLWC